MLWIKRSDSQRALSDADLDEAIHSLLEQLGRRKKILAIVPDITRMHSMAGEITQKIWRRSTESLSDILPALGTHYPMSSEERQTMYGNIPEELFRTHQWRSDTVEVGIVSSEFVKDVSHGAVDYPITMKINRLLSEGGHDLILSIGQVVPHEVIGMANYNKNIFVGVGGAECINKSHFLGAAYGMEKIMGRADTPVRRVLNYASENFIADLPIVYILTVVAADAEGKTRIYGLFAGDDEECFLEASDLALKLNFTMLDEPVETMLVYLDPQEYRSTWLGNKAVYRSRMAMADGGKLIILAPGLKEFGEDPEIDRLIRKFGYLGRETILSLVQSEEDLKNNLSAAAHMIHGSSDDRFSITYCTAGLSREEIEGVNYRYEDLDAMMKKYNPADMNDGWNTVGGERVYYISNPALGLWSLRFDLG